ncbi:heteroglycan glucosidase 1 [Actinidia rufa]|uniref:Heteroglycan glucosidase 1 n=1 Tax=Actinidia rufa TaxID=165716 RepID=A0A7J0GZU4_9ERIC|nr:heteroglycan glucosidase 1 [Actinidia rufa]
MVTSHIFGDGKAKGVHFEDDGDGYEFTRGGYLLTTYVAELESSVVTVRISKTEGSLKRPKRRLHVQVLLGGFAMVDSWGTDGEILQVMMPSEDEVSSLVSVSEKQYNIRMESAKRIPEVEKVSGHKGSELSRSPIELKSAVWALKVVPWIGGRIISMEHLPSGTQWLHSRVDVNGYEEFSGTEYRSAGCSEQYAVIEKNLVQAGERESLMLVCLRVHPMFTLLHPTESYVLFTSVDGSKHEVRPESGEWMLVDRCLGLGLVNRFNLSEVYKCFIHWGHGTLNLELWSENRPVSKQSPLRISHEYEVRGIS